MITKLLVKSSRGARNVAKMWMARLYRVSKMRGSRRRYPCGSKAEVTSIKARDVAESPTVREESREEFGSGLLLASTVPLLVKRRVLVSRQRPETSRMSLLLKLSRGPGSMAYMGTFKVYWVNKTRGSRRNGMWGSLGICWLVHGQR